MFAVAASALVLLAYAALTAGFCNTACLGSLAGLKSVLCALQVLTDTAAQAAGKMRDAEFM